MTESYDFFGKCRKGNIDYVSENVEKNSVESR